MEEREPAPYPTVGQVVIVPIADFRANLKKYADILRAGGLEILVTNHGKAILRCLTPDDVLPEVENPPGVNVELMERLLSGEGEEREPAPKYSPFTFATGPAKLAETLTVTISAGNANPAGDPRYHTGVSGAAGSTLGRGGAGGSLMTPSGPTGVTVGPEPTPRFVFPSDLNDGLFRPSPTEVHRVVDGVDVGPVADDAGKVTVVDDIGPRIVAPAVTTPRKRTPKPPPPSKEPKPRGPSDLARLLQWPKEAFPVNFQKPRPGKGDDWTLWGQAGHKRVWPGLGKLERAEALGWCIKAVEGQER